MPSVMTTLDDGGALRVAWTPGAVEKAIHLGLLSAEERYELIEGELYSKMGQSWPHSFAVDALLVAFAGLDSVDFLWSAQTPLELGENYPEPDFYVLRGGLEGRKRVPGASEALLVVEVADSSLAFDARVKARLYASAGIPVFWLIDLAHSVVRVHTKPKGGAYSVVETFEVGAELPPAFPGAPPLAVSKCIAPD